MTPRQIVDEIERLIGVTGAPSQVRDTIERVYLDSIGASAAQAAEESDRLQKKVVAEINRRRKEKEEAGEIAILHTRGINEELLHGSSHVFVDDSDLVRTLKLNRASANEIYTAIRNLSFEQFEVLGRSVLRELGCHTARVTPHAGDQGIDFYGQFAIGDLLNIDPTAIKLMHETKVVLVGQAKHYPNRAIGPSTVRELIGALSLARSKVFSRVDLDLFCDVQLLPFSPVLALLFSTGVFTKGARALSTKAGLIVFSGWQLSVFLADKGIGIVADGDDVRFDEANFFEWLD